MITIEAPVEEQDAALLASAAAEKIARVPGGDTRTTGSSQAWQFSGNVD
jgi:hypothetical protein